MSARRPAFAARRRGAVLAAMIALAALWLAAASRIHVNASWSDGAWGYAAFPLLGEKPPIGDRVLFEPPADVGSKVPYLKTVRGVPGMRIEVDEDGTVRLDGEPVARAKAHALDGHPFEAIAPAIIPPGHFYLHADHVDSHDSREQLLLVGTGQCPERREASRVVVALHPLERQVRPVREHRLAGVPGREVVVVRPVGRQSR